MSHVRYRDSMLQPHYSPKLGQPLNPAYSLSLSLSLTSFFLSLSLFSTAFVLPHFWEGGRETREEFDPPLSRGLVPILSLDSLTLFFQFLRTLTHFHRGQNRKNPRERRFGGCVHISDQEPESEDFAPDPVRLEVIDSKGSFDFIGLTPRRERG